MPKPNQAEFDDLFNEAQTVSFAAEDAGNRDDFAEGVYQTLQWLTGQADRPRFDDN